MQHPPHDLTRGLVRKQAVLDAAGGAVEVLACYGPRPADTGRRAALRETLAVFRFRLIPDLVVDVSIIKTHPDGPAAAPTPRFSVAG